jgi:hypothetical protein
MNIIYSTNEFDICQDKRKNTMFTIITNNNNNNKNNNNNLCNSPDLLNPLFNSIIKTNLINNATIVTQTDNNKTLFFKALTVESFNQFKERQNKINNTKKLPYNLILHIIYSLSKQITYLLKNESKCFYKFDISNILVIDDCKFIYLSCEDLNDVKENKIIICRPISKTLGYLSPELKNAKSIPILVSYKTIFYSLASFILDNIPPNEETNEETKLSWVKDTKLYFFLKRCLYNEPVKRFLLYV